MDSAWPRQPVAISTILTIFLKWIRKGTHELQRLLLKMVQWTVKSIKTHQLLTMLFLVSGLPFLARICKNLLHLRRYPLCLVDPPPTHICFSLFICRQEYKLVYVKNAKNHRLMSRCPSLTRYSPPMGLNHGLIHTLICAFFRKDAPRASRYHREIVDLDDGGHIGLDWSFRSEQDMVNKSKPTVCWHQYMSPFIALTSLCIVICDLSTRYCCFMA